MKLTSWAKTTKKHHQFLQGDLQVPPTYPNVAKKVEKSWYIDYCLQKSVEIVFPLNCSHLIFLDESAVIQRIEK